MPATLQNHHETSSPNLSSQAEYYTYTSFPSLDSAYVWDQAHAFYALI